jgi:hypothetical protein
MYAWALPRASLTTNTTPTACASESVRFPMFGNSEVGSSLAPPASRCHSAVFVKTVVPRFTGPGVPTYS